MSEVHIDLWSALEQGDRDRNCPHGYGYNRCPWPAGKCMNACLGDELVVEPPPRPPRLTCEKEVFRVRFQRDFIAGDENVRFYYWRQR